MDYNNNVEDGPDGVRDNRSHIAECTQPVGVGDVSKEHTGDSDYLFRPAPGTPSPLPRSVMPGEIGWGVPWLTDYSTTTSGQQIVMGTFRQMAEDRTTQADLEPWYAGPEEPTPPGSQGYYRENIFSGRPDTNNASPEGNTGCAGTMCSDLLTPEMNLKGRG